MRHGRAVLERAVQALLTLVALSVLLFALLASMPGTAADMLVMSNPNVRAEDLTRLMRLRGLDRPWYVQYWRWMYGHHDALDRPQVDFPAQLNLEPGDVRVVEVARGLTLQSHVSWAVASENRLSVTGPAAGVAVLLATARDVHGQETLVRSTVVTGGAQELSVPPQVPNQVLPVEGGLILDVARVLPGATNVTLVTGPGAVEDGAWRFAQQGPGQKVVVLGGQRDGAVVHNGFVVELAPLPDGARFNPGLVFGEMGFSTVYKRPVAQLLAGRVGATLRLMAPALLLSALLALVLGTLAGRRQGTWLDRLVLALATFATSVPVFWSGVLLVLLFAVELRWFPPGGMEPPGGGDLWDMVAHAVLPVAVLTFWYGGRFLRYVRDAMAEVMAADFIRTARAVGLPEWRVLAWALRAAVVPFVTVLALNIPAMFSGALLTETVFSWPGMGRLIYDAVLNNDHGVAMVAFLLSAALVLLGNALADALHAWLDPRVAQQR
jgi:peptide/nickel transport system permease protein